MYGLQEAQQSHNEGSLSTTIYRSNVGQTRWQTILLFPRWVFRLQPNYYSTRGSGKDYIHLLLWNFCFQMNAIWFMQCSSNRPEMYNVYFLRYG